MSHASPSRGSHVTPQSSHHWHYWSRHGGRPRRRSWSLEAHMRSWHPFDSSLNWHPLSTHGMHPRPRARTSRHVHRALLESRSLRRAPSPRVRRPQHSLERHSRESLPRHARPPPTLPPRSPMHAAGLALGLGRGAALRRRDAYAYAYIRRIRVRNASRRVRVMAGSRHGGFASAVAASGVST